MQNTFVCVASFILGSFTTLISTMMARARGEKMFGLFSKKKKTHRLMSATALNFRIETEGEDGGIADAQTGQMMSANLEIVTGLAELLEGNISSGKAHYSEALRLLEESSQPDGPSYGKMVHNSRDVLAQIDVQRSERIFTRAVNSLTATEHALQRAQLYQSISRMRSSVGNDSGAVEALAAAVESIERNPGEIREALKIKREYGTLISDCGEPEKGVSIFDSISPQTVKEFGEISEENFNLQDSHAIALLKSDNVAGALTHAQIALELCDELFGENSLRGAHIMGITLASIYRALGQADMREVVQRRAERIYRSIGEDNLELEDVLSYASLLGNIATTLTERADWTGAQQYLEHAVALRTKYLGEAPAIITSLTKLTAVCAQAGEFAAAEGHVSRLIAICRTHLGEDHPQTQNSLDLQHNILNDSRRSK